MSKKFLMIILLVAIMISANIFAAPYATINDLDRGHRILLEKGFQLQATLWHADEAANTTPWYWGGWARSNFTTLFLLRPSGNCTFGDFITECPPFPRIYNGDEFRWARAIGFGTDTTLSADELPYSDKLVSLQYKDEQTLDAAGIAEAQTWLSQARINYPEVISYVNRGPNGILDTANMQTFMNQAQPDLITYDYYPFQEGVWAGGSPTPMYMRLGLCRSLAIAGNDGTGNEPIPYGAYMQGYIDGSGGWPSESENRLNYFAAMAFGYTFLNMFELNATSNDFFGLPVTFRYYAETNRLAKNFGNTLVRLFSTDVSLVLGKHGAGIKNTLPDYVDEWSNDNVWLNINAENLGTFNNGLPGDIVVGKFEVLSEDIDGAAINEEYIMLVNGLADPNGTAKQCSQKISITLSSQLLSQGIDTILSLDADTGKVGEIFLTQSSGNLNFSIKLEGGTGVILKLKNGNGFVGIPNPANCQDAGITYYAGDINKDCYVNFGDVVNVFDNWLDCTDSSQENCEF